MDKTGCNKRGIYKRFKKQLIRVLLVCMNQLTNANVHMHTSCVRWTPGRIRQLTLLVEQHDSDCRPCTWHCVFVLKLCGPNTWFDLHSPAPPPQHAHATFHTSRKQSSQSSESVWLVHNQTATQPNLMVPSSFDCPHACVPPHSAHGACTHITKPQNEENLRSDWKPGLETTGEETRQTKRRKKNQVFTSLDLRMGSGNMWAMWPWATVGCVVSVGRHCWIAKQFTNIIHGQTKQMHKITNANVHEHKNTEHTQESEPVRLKMGGWEGPERQWLCLWRVRCSIRY